MKTCAECGADIGYLSITHLTVIHADNEFCDVFCLDSFIDACQREQDIRNGRCPDCGSGRCMTDRETGLVCNNCGASYLL